jgi:hypothetical protein
MLYRDYVRMVRRNVADRGERRRCYRALARWWRVNQNLHIFVSDLIGFVSPRAHASIRQVRTRFFRPEAERMRSV